MKTSKLKMPSKRGGKKVPGLMKMPMKERMAKLRSMRVKKGGKKHVKMGGQFGEIAIPAAAIAIGSAAPAVLGGLYEGGKSLYHYMFDKKTKPTPYEPRPMYTSASFRGNGVSRPSLMTPRKKGGMLQSSIISGPLA